MELVVPTGTISRTKLHSDGCHQQTNTSLSFWAYFVVYNFANYLLLFGKMDIWVVWVLLAPMWIIGGVSKDIQPKLLLCTYQKSPAVHTAASRTLLTREQMTLKSLVLMFRNMWKLWRSQPRSTSVRTSCTRALTPVCDCCRRSCRSSLRNCISVCRAGLLHQASWLHHIHNRVM